jgi:hypothetical protein
VGRGDRSVCGRRGLLTVYGTRIAYNDASFLLSRILF